MSTGDKSCWRKGLCILYFGCDTYTELAQETKTLVMVANVKTVNGGKNECWRQNNAGHKGMYIHCTTLTVARLQGGHKLWHLINIDPTV